RIWVKVVDNSENSFEKGFDILVLDMNDPPEDIQLSNKSLEENSEVGSLVGYFSVIDQDKEDEHTYQLVEGQGSEDNETFDIENNELLLKGSLDFAKKSVLTIRVKVTDKKNTSFEKEFTISLSPNQDPTLEWIIPTAFTPNGDGENDTWTIENIEDFQKVEVNIFNKQGQVLFSSNGFSKDWDGKYNGKLLPMDVYYYVIKLHDLDKVLSGSVMLIR
ncbi:T9SS type B sorting domain-containing protein, partial [Xanthovirga aplysinae]|uniref:T9SS type B sorting domain-containing protein n=1 Tax=Xanthovirga aplysinae TaxID=2529853 RepID=UPI0012BC5167